MRKVERRCAVVRLPGGAADRAAASLRRASATGDFSEIVGLDLPEGDARESLALAARTADAEGFGWLLALGGDETLVPDALQKLAPALRLHDAVWGAAGTLGPEGLGPEGLGPDGAAPIDPVTRLAAQDEAAFHHCALRWWIGESHFVRPAAALAALAGAGGPGWYADYMRALWRGGRALKTAQTMTSFRGAVPQVAEAVRARLLARLDAEPVFTTVAHGGATFRLPYTGRNAGIERAHTRGQFYEHEELSFLAKRFPPGMRIVDAGANTGNHAVFFAGPMQAEVLPIEPDAGAARALAHAVAANGLANVDLSRLGTAVGAEPGRMRAIFSEGGWLGATRLVADPEGEIPVRPLDDLVPGRVDLLKIDVEGMEMDVLAGAKHLIARDRPALFIEVADGTVSAFLAWTDRHAYRIERLFPDKGHCNFVLVPTER